jgi:hypothetical protein
VTGPVIAPCGYPYASGNPLTSVIFNEDECLGGIEAVGGSLAAVKLFYTDEHAMTLGVRSVVVKSASGTVTKDYPVSLLSANPGALQNPQTGSNILFGDQAGLDQMMRPMWPSLFITDTTSDPNSRIGDWQFGGRPFNPTAVFGSWKAAVRNVDSTVNPPVVSITPDADPAKNGLNLGPGADPMPAAVAALKNEGYHTEVVWYLPLIPGHTYRVQVIVHDGDQNKVGGDVGEACVDYCAGGNNPPPPNDGGLPPNQSTTPPPDCGPDSHVCGSGSTDPTYVCPTRSNGSVGQCINGCCMWVG